MCVGVTRKRPSKSRHEQRAETAQGCAACGRLPLRAQPRPPQAGDGQERDTVGPRPVLSLGGSPFFTGVRCAAGPAFAHASGHQVNAHYCLQEVFVLARRSAGSGLLVSRVSTNRQPRWRRKGHQNRVPTAARCWSVRGVFVGPAVRRRQFSGMVGNPPVPRSSRAGVKPAVHLRRPAPSATTSTLSVSARQARSRRAPRNRGCSSCVVSRGAAHRNDDPVSTVEAASGALVPGSVDP